MSDFFKIHTISLTQVCMKMSSNVNQQIRPDCMLSMNYKKGIKL